MVEIFRADQDRTDGRMGAEERQRQRVQPLAVAIDERQQSVDLGRALRRWDGERPGGEPASSQATANQNPDASVARLGDQIVGTPLQQAVADLQHVKIAALDTALQQAMTR